MEKINPEGYRRYLIHHGICPKKVDIFLSASLTDDVENTILTVPIDREIRATLKKACLNGSLDSKRRNMLIKQLENQGGMVSSTVDFESGRISFNLMHYRHPEF